MCHRFNRASEVMRSTPAAPSTAWRRHMGNACRSYTLAKKSVLWREVTQAPAADVVGAFVWNHIARSASPLPYSGTYFQLGR
jgi:hypothetical protein